MAGNDHPPRRRETDKTDSLTRKFRIISGSVILVLFVAAVFIDSFGRLFIDPNFHVSDFLFGLLVGAVLLFGGVEGLNKLPTLGGRN